MGWLANQRVIIKFSLSVFIPVLITIIMAGYIVTEKVRLVRETSLLTELAPMVSALSGVVHELQKERGATALFLGSHGEKFGDEMRAQRTRTDDARTVLERSMRAADVNDLGPDFSTKLKAARENLDSLQNSRPGFDSLTTDAKSAIVNITGIVRSLLDVVDGLAGVSTDPQIGNAITNYLRLMEAKERAGLERAVGSSAFAAGQFTPDGYRRFMTIVSEEQLLLADFLAHATPELAAFYKTAMDNPATRDTEKMRGIAMASLGTASISDVSAADWFKVATVRINLLKQIEDETSAKLTDQANARHSSANTSLGVVVVVLLVSLLAAAIVGWGIVNDMTASISSLVAAMDRLARNDLDAQISGDGRQDEIGTMARAVTVFKAAMISGRQAAQQRDEQVKAQENHTKTITQLVIRFQALAGELTQSVLDASRDLESTAKAMSNVAEDSTREINAVASASEQTTGNIQTVSAAAEELSSSIQEIGRQIHRSTQISANAISEAGAAEATVSSLAEMVSRIGDIVLLINDIASQTNLLALNATIEAARAGDAGKGFAVVANEVKSLANQTAKATGDIGDQIGSVQAQTDKVVSGIAAIASIIREVGEITSGIAAAIEEQTAATQEIARSVEMAASSTSDVTRNIAGVQRAAGATDGAAHNVLNSATTLNGKAGQLNQEITSFLRAIESA